MIILVFRKYNNNLDVNNDWFSAEYSNEHLTSIAATL